MEGRREKGEGRRKREKRKGGWEGGRKKIQADLTLTI